MAFWNTTRNFTLPYSKLSFALLAYFPVVSPPFIIYQVMASDLP